MARDERLAELCVLIKASDRDAFAELFLSIRGDLLRYVVSMIGDAVTAHDLVQDVFVALWERREALDTSQSLQALTYRMSRNRSLNHLRMRNVRRRYNSESEFISAGTPPPDLHANDLAARLHGWIAALPDRQREAISLTRYSQLSHREAAEVMGISPRTLNNHLVRALATLHSRLEVLERDIPHPS